MNAVKFDEGKLKPNLIPAAAIEGLAKAFTYGAGKYGEHNYLNGTGMSWTRLINALQRHLHEFCKGNDFDESGLKHLDHIGATVAMLQAYHVEFPENDDRLTPTITRKKVALDIDEVLCDFIGGYSKKFDRDKAHLHWAFSYDVGSKMDELKNDKDFWLNLEPLVDSVPFEPECYITSRNIPSEWTMEWLEKHNFPCRPVHTVGLNQSKIEVAKANGIQWAVDDKYENYKEYNANGICCWLMTAEHNLKYDVGYRRIESLNDIV